jgi:hypothetical protein
MEKIYQVFVSSTFEDLQEERKEVMQALLELDCMPAGMELFPASNDDQWTLIKRVIDTCDYYLLIIGGRYGSVNEEGISYTQMEFEYAQEIGKPIISFLPQNPETIPAGKSEKDSEKQQKLEAFKNLAKRKLVKYWENPEQLGSIVSRSMIKLIKDFPAEGWVKANGAVDETSVKEIARLQKENAELVQRLNEISTEAPKGTEVFAQGNDQVEIKFYFTAEEKRCYQSYSCEDEEFYTWNELFACVAPQMIDECTDGVFEISLSKYIQDHSNWKEKSEFSKLKNAQDFEISQESFNMIKVQFRALGLITSGEKKRSKSDKQTYWKLTPYGDYVMTQLLAIRHS